MKLIEENWMIDFVGNPFTEFQAKIKKLKRVTSKLEQRNIWGYFPPDYDTGIHSKGQGDTTRDKSNTGK
uniref:Putative ovule protein n=1 Tax=Solanum chacoense TaxID=4108 RepID=A0A0V0GU02_SOLCH